MCFLQLTPKFVMAISVQFEGKTPYSRLFINPILRKKKDKM